MAEQQSDLRPKNWEKNKLRSLDHEGWMIFHLKQYESKHFYIIFTLNYIVQLTLESWYINLEQIPLK